MIARRVVAMFILTFVACSTSPSAVTPSPTAIPESLSNKPTVEITYPVEGERVRGKDVLVALTVRAFELVDDERRDPKKGEGRLVYYLDVAPLPEGDDATDIEKGAGRAEVSSMTSHRWEDVSAGSHTLGVQLVDSDGSSLDPPATDTLEIVVGG